MKPVVKQELLSAFRQLGIKNGQVLMVHASLSSFGYVCGGAQTVIEALLESVGEDGTVMMPTQTWKNLDIVCVNDGSKDNSLEILETYAEKDSRIS